MKEPIAFSTSSHISSDSQIVGALGLNRYVVLTLYALAMVIAGPLLNNWAPLRSVLVSHGAYASECSAGDIFSSDGTCTAQQNRLARLPVISQSLQFAFAFLGGFLKDKLGSRVTAIIGFATQAFGFLTIGLANESFDGYMLGFIFLGAAAEPLTLSLIDVANLFPGYEGSVVAVIATARSLSFFMATIIQEIYESGVSFLWTWMGFAILIFALGVGAIVLVPDGGYHPRGAVAKEESDMRRESRRDLAVHERIFDREFWSLTVHPSYMLFVLYFISVTFRMGFFSASSDAQVPDALDFYGFVVPLSFLPCPLMGIAVDKVGHWFLLYLLNSFMLLAYIFLLIDGVWAQYVAVISTVIAMSFQSSQAYAVMVKIMPHAFLGRALGLCFFISGLLSMANASIYSAANNSNSFNVVDGIFVGVALLMFGAIVGMGVAERRSPLKVDYAQENYDEEMGASSEASS